MSETSTHQKPAARTIRREEPFTATKEAVAAAPKVPTEHQALPPKSAEQWRSIAEQVAQHRLFKRNEHFPLLKAAFPANRRMWTVDKFFPYAQGGALAVEEPSHLKFEVEEAKAKQAALAAIGVRMVILQPSTNYQQALEQLEALARPAPKAPKEKKE